AEPRARLWADCSIEESLDSLIECMQSPEASQTHKLLAARAFLAGCEYGPLVHRAVAMKETIAALIANRQDGDEYVRLPSSILYHSFFGDMRSLLVACEQVVQLAGDAKTSHLRVGLLQTAAIGFHKAGQQDAAFEIWKRALDLCTQTGLQFGARNLRMVLA